MYPDSPNYSVWYDKQPSPNALTQQYHADGLTYSLEVAGLGTIHIRERVLESGYFPTRAEPAAASLELTYPVRE